jgi:hypothetical protein
MRLVQVINGKIRSIAEYNITPGNRDFVFAIPGDTGVSYRLFVNIMKQEGRHPKLVKAYTLPLTLNADQNYTLKITTSKLNDTKKTGWELKQDLAKSSVTLVSGNVLSPMNKNGLQISLQTVENGTKVSYSSVHSNSDGSYEIPALVKQEGFYYLSSVRWRVRVYLKPADRLQVDVDHKSGSPVSLTGSQENQTLFQWQQLISPITTYGYNLSIVNVESIDLNEYTRRMKHCTLPGLTFYNKIDKSNPKFAKAFQNAMDVDQQLRHFYFLLQKSAKKVNGYQPSRKNFNEVPAFYKQFIQPGKFNNTSILQ